MKKKSVAVIILNYNSWKLTIQFIEKEIPKVRGIENAELIVIDNCSSNDSAEQLEKWNENHNRYILIKSDKNGGYAAGNNIGLKWAYEHGFKYGWVCNTDILFPDPNILNLMIHVFDMDNKIGVVSPRIYSPTGIEMNRNLYRPSVWDLTLGKVSYRQRGRKINPSLAGKDDTYCYNYRSQGCCMLTSLEVMSKVNYMDEHTFLYMEEPILAERLLSIHIKEACCLKTKAIHNHSTTVASEAKRKRIFQWQHESEMYYYKKYRKFGKIEATLCGYFTAIYYFVIMKLKKFN